MKAVFSEAQFNPKLAKTLADEAGSRGSSRPSTTTRWAAHPPTRYLGMMRWNMQQIVEALR